MRLFLSSYRAGQHDDRLKQFIGRIDKVAVITNAKDYKIESDRQLKVAENFDYWRSLKIKPTEIDLRPYFHKPGAEQLLSNHNFIWLAGGNVFLLRRALKYTKLDIFLGDAARSNQIILGGESAGAMVMGPTLRYSEMDGDEDSTQYIPNGYEKKVIWSGLDLISYVTVPHYNDPDYSSEIDQYIGRLKQAGLPYKPMTNDQAIIISSDREEFLE